MQSRNLARPQALSCGTLMEMRVAGGSKPKPGSKRAATFQDGAKKSGGLHARKHAGPGRASKTEPKGTRGKQTQRRIER
jgi:hypothetical protein